MVTDEVAVPAGIFTHCLRLRGKGKTQFHADDVVGDVAISVEEVRWYAPSVGLVRSELVESSPNGLLGTRKMVSELEALMK